MNIYEIIKKIDHDEKMMYIDSNATEYFRNIYYSKRFSNIMEKLNSQEKLTNDDWEYLIDRLYMVTYKATIEEDDFSAFDRIHHSINRIGAKIFKEGRIHNECVRMVAFLESVKLEKEINIDLLSGLERIEFNKNETDLDILLKQHREAAIFRDNQDAFLDSYRKSEPGVMTRDDMLYMNSMDRSYIREKELVKEYK